MNDRKQIEEEYRNTIQDYRNAIIAWKNVKRLSKKDGSDFANIGKNFTNANIIKKYSWGDELYIQVYYYYASGGYAHDDIEIKDNDTVNDIFNNINKKIVLYEKYIKSYTDKLTSSERVFDEVDRTVSELLKFCKDNGFSSYEICEYIKDNYWRS